MNVLFYSIPYPPRFPYGIFCVFLFLYRLCYDKYPYGLDE